MMYNKIYNILLRSLYRSINKKKTNKTTHRFLRCWLKSDSLLLSFLFISLPPLTVIQNFHKTFSFVLTVYFKSFVTHIHSFFHIQRVCAKERDREKSLKAIIILKGKMKYIYINATDA